MEHWPRISIVTPSYNQGQYIAQTIESALAQNYPNLEHIVMDGGSTDGTMALLRRFNHLKIISEPDGGQSNAVNKGFRLASGDVWGILNSDDTLLPGALHRVAQEIDRHRGRHIVMGRCQYIDDQGRYIGIEHPSYFESHRRVLEIWKSYSIPQPATFWTPEVWKACGPVDESSHYCMDYDLFCRFSRRYRFWFVDQIFATYRLHAESKTMQKTSAENLEDSIHISRRYWGPLWLPQYWSLRLSLAGYRFNRTGRAGCWLKRSRESWRQREWLAAAIQALIGAALAPDVAFYSSGYPLLRKQAKGAVAKVLDKFGPKPLEHPQTAAYGDHHDVWSDGWAGPEIRVMRDSGGGATKLCVRGRSDPRYFDQPLVLAVRLDGMEVGRHVVTSGEEFFAEFPVPEDISRTSHAVDILASASYVPDRFIKNKDYRPLSWQVGEVFFA